MPPIFDLQLSNNSLSPSLDFLAGFPKNSISHLDLSDVTVFTSAQFYRIGEQFPDSLTFLSIKNCHFLSPHSFMTLKHFTKLESLNLENTSIETPALLFLLCQKTLRKLNLSATRNLSHKAYSELSRLVELEELALSKNSQVTDVTISNIIQFPNILKERKSHHHPQWPFLVLTFSTNS